MQALTPLNLNNDTAGALFTHNTQQLTIMHPLSIGKHFSGLYLQPIFAISKRIRVSSLVYFRFFNADTLPNNCLNKGGGMLL